MLNRFKTKFLFHCLFLFDFQPLFIQMQLLIIIRQRFSQDPDVSRYTIGIRTVDGSVTLSGTVGSYSIRDRAVQLARTTDGVRAVDSRIVVNTNL